MIVVKDWGPAGIADVAARAVRVAYRRLNRQGATGEASRLRYWFGDDYRKDAAELIVANLGAQLCNAPARQVLRQLSTVIMQRHIQAEINSRKKRA